MLALESRCSASLSRSRAISLHLPRPRSLRFPTFGLQTFRLKRMCHNNPSRNGTNHMHAGSTPSSVRALSHSPVRRVLRRQSSVLCRRNAFPITETELKLIAVAAINGDNSNPVNG